MSEANTVSSVSATVRCVEQWTGRHEAFAGGLYLWCSGNDFSSAHRFFACFMDDGHTQEYLELTFHSRGAVVERFKQCLAFAALVVAGCAAQPELESSNTVASVAPAATATDARSEAVAVVTPDLVVDVNDLAARAAAPIICRDMLKPNSNVIVRQCLTEADWKRYRTVEAQNAAQIVRMMQGGGYR